VAGAASLVLVEKLILEYMLPPWVPLLESLISSYGLFTFLCVGFLVDFGVGYWTFGGEEGPFSCFGLPELCHWLRRGAHLPLHFPATSCIRLARAALRQHALA